MAEEKVIDVVNEIESINSKIDSLELEKHKLINENHVDLIEHDLNTIKNLIETLECLNTEEVIDLIENHDVKNILEEIISDVEILNKLPKGSELNN